MNKSFRNIVLQALDASEITIIKKIQDLWSGYGTIARYQVRDGTVDSVVIKHVSLPNKANHPRGWDSNISHQRKIKSYDVEINWYRNWSNLCSRSCCVPRAYALERTDDEFLIVLEDLSLTGFPGRKHSVTISEMRVCIKWLAHFHASFMGEQAIDLWETGSYWHLETRPDELRALKDKNLRAAAPLIDQKLKNSPFQTLIHGDAKLANFCFSLDGKKVAAVDFQYVGGGCGVKDLAYFIGSCLEESECEKLETELLDYYFSILSNVLRARRPELDLKALEANWRALFPVAWADFHRFLKGWSPGHWKINSYSERLTERVLAEL